MKSKKYFVSYAFKEARGEGFGFGQEIRIWEKPQEFSTELTEKISENILKDNRNYSGVILLNIQAIK